MVRTEMVTVVTVKAIVMAELPKDAGIIGETAAGMTAATTAAAVGSPGTGQKE